MSYKTHAAAVTFVFPPALSEAFFPPTRFLRSLGDDILFRLIRFFFCLAAFSFCLSSFFCFRLSFLVFLYCFCCLLYLHFLSLVSFRFVFFVAFVVFSFLVYFFCRSFFVAYFLTFLPHVLPCFLSLASFSPSLSTHPFHLYQHVC